jgi:Ca2+-binding RTX toxin-like protein
VIAAQGGDDVITGVGADDVVCAGAGDDVVSGSDRRARLVVDLGPGDDRIRLAAAGQVRGGAGADRIVIGGGPAELDGGPGDDYLRAVSKALPYGNPINTPCLHYRRATRPVRVDLEAGRSVGVGHDVVVGFRCVNGSGLGDAIVGSNGRDSLSGFGGADLIDAGSGDDRASGGAGDDRIHLGDGFDYGIGDEGRDRLYGEAGPDVLEGWSQSDYLEGGSGADQVYGAIFCAIGGNSYDTAGLMDGAPDELFGGSGSDYLVGDSGSDRIDGGSGYDWAQPGYHDRRVDWVDDVEGGVNGCLENVAMDQPLRPADVLDVEPW